MRSQRAAIEEQFYLVWPILLLGVFKLGANKKIVRRACLVLCSILSAVVIAVLAHPRSMFARVAADEKRVMSATLKKPLVDGQYDVVFIGDSGVR